MGNYLVTGAAGFIGSKLAEKLVNEGHQVITIDNLSTGYLSNIPEGVQFLQGNCQDQDVLDQLDNEKFDTVFHLAGQSSGEISFDDPVYDLQTNGQSTLQLLELCKKTGCKKFVYASTMSVYGITEDAAICETHATRPQSFYGVGKLASENYLRIYSQFGIATAALRLFNTYGPGQNLQNLRQGMVSIFLAHALQNQKIHVMGAANRFRDFIYIDDVVNAFLYAEKDIKPSSYSDWNISTGVRTTIESLVNTIIKKLGSPIEVKYEGSTLGDQFGIYGDSSLFQKQTGWKPEFDLNKGMEVMVNWAKKLHDDKNSNL